MNFFQKISWQKLIPTVILVVFLIWSFLIQFVLTSKFDEVKAGVARWPQFSVPHLELALYLFQSGSTQAQKELALGKKALFPNQNLINKVEKVVNQPQLVKNHIDYWQGFSQKGVDSNQAYLHLALLNFQLYRDKEATEAWQKAFWLDPNDKITEEVKKVIQ
jgi:hypothetical protein